MAHSQQDNIYFSSSNVIEDSSLTVNEDSSTPLDWIKNSTRSRFTRWTNPDGIFTVKADLKQKSKIAYCCIAGHDLPPTAKVRFLIYNENGDLLHNSTYTEVGDLIPAGEFIAGQDRWNYVGDALQNIHFHKLDVPVLDATKVWTQIDHGYTYEPPPEPVTNETTTITVESDGVLRQSDVTGIVSVEAENCERTNAGSDAWVEQTDTDASNDIRMYKNSNIFYPQTGTGPSLKFVFNAVDSGTHKIWLRTKSEANQGNSLYTVFDGDSSINVFVPYADFTDGNFQWHNTKTVNLVANTLHSVEIFARDRFLSVDKILILPNGDAPPADNNEGPAESEFGTITTTTTDGVTTVEEQIFKNYVNIRTIMAGDLVQLFENPEHGLSISYTDDPSNIKTESGYFVSDKSQNKVREVTFDLAVLEARDRRVMVELAKKYRGKPFLVNIYPTTGGVITAQHLFLCKIINRLNFSYDLPDIHSTTVTLGEI